MTDNLGTLEYKGYTCNIQYDELDKIYYSKLVNVVGLVSFEAESIPELEAVFKEVVDEYEDYIIC